MILVSCVVVLMTNINRLGFGVVPWLSLVCTLLFGSVAETMSRAVDALMATFKPVVEDHQFGCWMIKATKCHILASEGPERQKYVLFSDLLSP